MAIDEENELDDDMNEDDPFENPELENEIEENLIEEWCPNCKEMKPHVAVSRDKIACAACNFEHLRDVESTGTPVVLSVLSDEDKASPESLLAAWERLTDVPESDQKPYTIRLKLGDGDVIRHSKFGVGVVVKMTDSTKAEVLFKDGLKLLVCGK